MYKKIVFIAVGIIFLIGIGVLYFNDSPLKAAYYFNKGYKIDQQYPQGSVEAMRYYQKSINIYERIGGAYQVADYSLVKSYIYLALLHMKFGNILQVERLILKALALGKDKIPDSLKAKSYLLLASSSEPERSREYIAQALEIAQRLDLKSEIARAYFLLGLSYEYKALFSKAEENYLKAIRLIEEHPDSAAFVGVVSLYERLGELYMGEGNVNRSLKYYHLALYATKRGDDEYRKAYFMKMLSLLYEKQGTFKRSCEFWAEAKQKYYTISDDFMKDMNSIYMEKYCAS